MTQDALNRPNATTYNLEDIVYEVLAGRVRIPSFQRQFRWQWEDVRRLFESITKGYPIGSLLLWARPAPAAEIELGALRFQAPKYAEGLWVVDGQQRLSSLASALSDVGHKSPRFGLSFDLRERKFIKPRVGDPDYCLPLPVAFDLQRLLEWFAERPGLDRDYLNEATRLAKLIRQFSIPAYIVKEQDEAILRDIFDRMNNYGKRLSRAEVFSALHSETGAEGPTSTSLQSIAEAVDAQTRFGPIDEDTVLRVVLVRRDPNVTREIRSEYTPGVEREFPEEEPTESYRQAQDALVAAVRFLQTDAKVPHFGFLPYRYLLVVLSRFFAHHSEPSPRNRTLLRRWFWRAALAGPEFARGSWTGAMRTLARCIVPDHESTSVQRLLDSLSEARPQRPRLDRFNAKAAESRVILCALWNLGPRSPGGGEAYDLDALLGALADRTSTADSVAMLLRREPEAQRKWVANRVFVLGEDTPEALRAACAARPLTMAESTWDGFLMSHGITEAAADLLDAGDEAGFLGARQAMLGTVVTNFLDQMTEEQFEDTSSLADFEMDDSEDDSG